MTAEAQAAVLAAGIRRFLAGDYDCPRQHRHDGGKCQHGVWFYEECTQCDAAHFRGVLRDAGATA